MKLFASYLYDTAVNVNNCLLTEPGFYANATAIYLAIQCEKFSGASVVDRNIYLLKCTSPCNVTSAAAWSYVGRLFNRAEALAVQASFNGGYAAPAIAETSTGVYLILTPTIEPDAIYRGCSVFRFTNLNTGVLENVSGVPTLIKSTGNTAMFNGACGYASGAAASGILRSELSVLSLDGEFQLFLDRTQL